VCGGATQVKSLFEFREVDLVLLPGAAAAAPVYELIMIKRGSLSPTLKKTMDSLPMYARGLELYREREWARAADAFLVQLPIFPVPMQVFAKFANSMCF